MWMPSHSSQAVRPPCWPSGPEPRDVRDAGEPADDRDVAVVGVAERLGRAAEEPAADRPGRVDAALHRALGHARASARSGFHGWTAASPTTKTSGCPGTVRSGSDEDAAVAVGLGAERGRRPSDER